MTTEGTYPYVHGGVSVWCDRLIKQLPDVEFALYAISPGVGKRPVWDLPDNVTSFVPIELAPSNGRRYERYPEAARAGFLDAFDLFLRSVLEDPADPSRGFLASVKSLYDAGQDMPIDIGLRSPEAFELVRRRWMDRRVGDRLDRMGPPSLHDVLEVTSSLARFLVPLQVLPDADIIHTTANGLSALPALAARWTLGTPVLLTEHGVYLRERFIEAHKMRGRDRVKAFHLLFFARLNEATLKISDRIAPVSDYNARWERETGADPDKIITIYNGVDPSLFSPIETEPDVPTVSWVGRVDPLKDVVTLIRSFAVVHEHLPEARLRLFGPIPEGNAAYHAECVKAIEEHGLGEVVTFEGLISPASLGFEAGHVVALSSISEGFPFTVIEAMMSGRATVSTDVGGVAEAVGEAGLMVPPRDPKAMGRAFLTLLEDDDLRRRLGREARERALEYFTLDHMANQYRDLYETMIDDAAAADVVSDTPVMAGGL